MNAQRWEYLKALRPSAPRYVHVSAVAGMVPNPIDEKLPLIPYVQRPGVTFDENRNKRKGMERVLGLR